MVKCFVAFIDFPRQGRNLRLETEECATALVLCSHTYDARLLCPDHFKVLCVGRLVDLAEEFEWKLALYGA